MPLPALHTPHATRLARLPIALLIACAAVAPHHALAYRAPQTYGNEADLDRHDTYRNRDGETVHAPARSKSGRAPEGTSALPRRHVQFQPPSARHVLGARRRRRLALTARNGRAAPAPAGGEVQ